jgi:hypothetical protein
MHILYSTNIYHTILQNIDTTAQIFSIFRQESTNIQQIPGQYSIHCIPLQYYMYCTYMYLTYSEAVEYVYLADY